MNTVKKNKKKLFTRNIKILIFVIFFISSIVFIGIELRNIETYIEEVPCVDNNDNIIKGVTCEQETVHPNSMPIVTICSSALIFVIVLSIIFFSLIGDE